MQEPRRPDKDTRSAVKGDDMKHTPGPWRIQEQIDKETGMVYLSGHNWGYFAGVIVEMDGGFPSKEGQANARLIAAAPELMEALKALISEHQDDPESWFPARLIPIINKAEAAIAKAEEKP